MVSTYNTNADVSEGANRTLSSRTLGQKFTNAQLDAYQILTARCYARTDSDTGTFKCFTQIPNGTIIQIGTEATATTTPGYYEFIGTTIIGNVDFIIWFYQTGAQEVKIYINCDNAGSMLGTEVENTKTLTPVYANWVATTGCSNSATFIDGTYDAVGSASTTLLPPLPAYVRI